MGHLILVLEAGPSFFHCFLLRGLLAARVANRLTWTYVQFSTDSSLIGLHP